MSSPFVRKRSLHDTNRTDRVYWQTRTYLERFQAVELISNPSLEHPEDAQQELPRVLKVTHRQRR